jgi:diguanylate cyclase (GGDEF)-like protein
MNRTTPEADRPRSWQARTRHYSIRTSLIALVTACVLPSLVALGIIVYEDHLQQEDAVQRETLLRAKGLMATIDRDIAKVESSLQVLAASGRLSSSDLTGFIERLRATPRSIVILNYLLIDRDGHELINTVVPEGEPMPTSGVPKELLKVFETGEPVVTQLYEGPVHHQPCIALSVPVRRNGEVVYALSAELSPAQLGGILVKEALPPNWVAALVDDQGTIVARSRSSWRFTGQKVSDGLRADLETHSDGTREGINKEGIPVIVSYTSSSLSGLRMVINAPRAVLVTKLSSSFAMLIGGGALALAIALWFAIRLAGNIGRSVEGLIKPALALGSGKPVELPDSTLKEADAVGQALLQAAEMLAQANHQAHHDALTGLCNRVLFDELAAHQLAAAQRSGTRLAILAIDLDHFKEVNDQHGHATGDMVLTTAADRIRQAIRGADVVSRRGGDEFTVLLNNVDQLLTQRIGTKLVSSLAKPYPGVGPAVSASIGVALFPDSGTSLQELLERADQALYEAKKAGKRRLAGDVVQGRHDITRIGAIV